MRRRLIFKNDPPIIVRVHEIGADAPASVFGDKPVTTTSIGYSINGSESVTVNPPVILGGGSTVSATTTGKDYTTMSYGTAPMTTGDYGMFVDTLREKIDFYTIIV